MTHQFRPTPFWQIIGCAALATFLTLVLVRRSVSGDFISAWAVYAVATSVVFSIAELIRRRSEKPSAA